MSVYKIVLLLILLIFQYSYCQEKEIALDEVKVKKNTKTFTNKNGNIKVDVANSIYNAISNPVDLLSKLPNIQVSPNKETISVIGKGNPLIYIDNQKVEVNDLNSLSVDDIKSIEIINNPSSKYEANGRVLILITRKLGKKEGYKIAVSENASFQKNFNNYFGINSSVKKNKFEFKANFNYNKIVVWESNGNNFEIPANNITSNYLVKAITKRPQFIFGGGVFYKINDDDYLSFNFNERTQKDLFDIKTDTYNENNNVINYIKTLNENDESRNFTNAFVNYNHKIKNSNANLFSGFQYSSFNQNIASFISNNFNNAGFELSQNRNQKFEIDVFSARTDFEKEFSNKMKLEIGALYLDANSDSYFRVNDVNSNINEISNYNYKEKNAALYSQFSGTVKRVNFSLGLRAENTIAKGKFETENNLSIDKNYINLFPKAKLEIALDSLNTITFNYAKSISRPNFSSTSQVSAYINPYFLWTNNTNLDPTIIDEISVSYQYKDKSVTASYNKMKNPVYYATSYNNSENLLTFKTENFKKQSGFNLDFTLPFKYKFWTMTNSISGILNKIEDDNAVVGSSKPYLYYYSNHLFSLPKEIEFAVTGWGLTKRDEGIFKRNAVFTLDLSLSKTFYKKWDCTISYNDVFKQMKFNEDFTINGVSAKGIYFTDANLVSFSIKYSFGKFKNSEFKEKTIDENASRIK